MKYLSIDLVLRHLSDSPSELRKLMLKAGQPAPPTGTISKWKERGWILAKWVGAVIWALACKGVNPLQLLAECDLDEPPETDQPEKDPKEEPAWSLAVKEAIRQITTTPSE